MPVSRTASSLVPHEHRFAQHELGDDNHDERHYQCRGDTQVGDGGAYDLHCRTQVAGFRIGRQVGTTAGDFQHAQGDDEGRDCPASTDYAVYKAGDQARGQSGNHRHWQWQASIGDQHAHDRRAQGHHRPHREIDTGYQQHIGHADGDDGKCGNLVRQGAEGDAGEEVFAGQAEKQHQYQQHRQQAEGVPGEFDPMHAWPWSSV